MRHVIRFFDKLEDRIRGFLSHWPIVYSLIGAVGIVLFWKGVWEWAEVYPILFGPMSMLLGLIILLSTGLMVSFFIGDSIILSGLKHEKKLVEKTEVEVRADTSATDRVLARLELLEKKIDALQK